MGVDVCYPIVNLTGEGMAENESPETHEVEHSYLDVNPTHPRRWLLVVGAFVVLSAFAVTFFGLYAINQGASPTLTPDPARLTQDAAVAGIAHATVPGTMPDRPTSTPTPSANVEITATTEPPTYTVQQGDTLLGIAQQLRVNADGLRTLNQISGETIFPNQVLLVPATITPRPETGPFVHKVTQGEALISIATIYKVTVDEIKALNGLGSDTIVVGQQILIPASGVRPPTPTPTPEPWRPSVITGDLGAVYSLTIKMGQISLHFPPDTRVATPGELANAERLVEKALDYSQDVLERDFNGRFDIYISADLLDAPHTALRSFSVPEKYRIFLLNDGSGTSKEHIYFATYALTHLFANRIFGEAASPLLGEGLAVFAASQALVGEADQEVFSLSPSQLCTALQQTGDLPDVTQPLELKGHLGYLDQHLAAGCFVGYLIETEGLAAFIQLYSRGDFASVYGRPIEHLVSDWIASIKAEADLPLNPVDLVSILERQNVAYRRLWANFAGSPEQFDAYEELDRARMAFFQGRLSSAREHLDTGEELLE